MPRVSIKSAQKTAQRAEGKFAIDSKTKDSLQNFALNFGIGTDNATSQTGYGFNPISRIRILLEWMYRGSWLAGMAVNVIADDMTRNGVDILGELDPDDIQHMERAAVSWQIWPKINQTIKWSRLYGGCICLPLIDGQDVSTPLRIETIGKGRFKGLYVLDRWQVNPSLGDLVTEFGPHLGQPKYYEVVGDAAALRGKKIHYSRCMRLLGVELPYYQAMMENMWGISVLERLNDRLIAFDSATTGVAQLIYRAYLRVVKIDNMREIVAAGGPAEANLYKWVEMMRRFQSLEGVTMIDAKDDAVVMPAPSFSGLSDALIQLGQQCGGALQMPMTKLFGQSPVGMNSTGESDLRMYYDGLGQQQELQLRIPVTMFYQCLARSEGIKLPEGFSLGFRSLWSMSEESKSEIAARDSQGIVAEYNAGIISDQMALKEIKQLSKITGRGTNITDDDIKAASNETGSQRQQEMMETQLDMTKEKHEREGESHELNMTAAEQDISQQGGKANGKANGKAA
jgi:phage-related protein (TIGR01555 family)